MYIAFIQGANQWIIIYTTREAISIFVIHVVKSQNTCILLTFNLNKFSNTDRQVWLPAPMNEIQKWPSNFSCCHFLFLHIYEYWIYRYMYFILDLTCLTVLFIYLFLINVKGHNSINIDTYTLLLFSPFLI